MRKIDKKILVINLAGMGDVILSSVAIKSLAKKFPESELYFLTYSSNAAAVIGCPYFKEVFFFEKKLTLKVLKTLFKIRGIKFDAVINLYNIHSLAGAIKMFLLFCLIGAKETFGRNTNGKGFFYRHKIDETSDFKKHDVETMFDVVSLLGAQEGSGDLELWVEERNDIFESFLERYNISANDAIACIHPGATRITHRWDSQNFAKVADKLSEQYGFKIIITGDASEKDLARRVAEKMKYPVAIAAGEFSLGDLAVCLRRSKIFITNDTGPMHVANVLDVPLVVISGNSPQAFFPFRKENTIVLQKTLKTGVFLNRHQYDLACLNAITCDDVMRAAMRLVENNFKIGDHLEAQLFHTTKS